MKKKAQFAKRAVSQTVAFSARVWTKGISVCSVLLPHLSPETSVCSSWKLFLQAGVQDGTAQGQGMRFLSRLFSATKVKRTKPSPTQSCTVFVTTINNILLGWPASFWVCLPRKRDCLGITAALGREPWRVYSPQGSCMGLGLPLRLSIHKYKRGPTRQAGMRGGQAPPLFPAAARAGTSSATVRVPGFPPAFLNSFPQTLRAWPSA